jgi:hypothetical protein
MKKELQEKLVEKYPKIFSEVGETPQKSCMAWGICIGDGWYMLVDNLCNFLQSTIDLNKDTYPQVVAAQVKEKFGGLRFYVNSANDEQYGAISFAEHLSYSICENCGSTEDITQTEGWVVTLCPKCMEERGKARVE